MNVIHIIIFTLLISVIGQFSVNAKALNEPCVISNTTAVVLDANWHVATGKISNKKKKWKKLRHAIGIPWYEMDSEINRNIFFKTIFKMTEPAKKLALYVPIHYRGARIYINNYRLCETRPFNGNSYAGKISGKSAIIPIPETILKQGLNNLVIQTGFLNNYGGFLKKIYIGPKKELYDDWIKNILWYGMLASIILFLTIFFFLIYWNRRNEQYYLYFSLLSFFFGLWIIGYNGIVFWIADYQWTYILFSYAGSILAPYMLLSFLHSFLELPGNKLTKVIKWSYIGFALSLVIEFFITGEVVFYNKYLYNPFNLITAFLVIYLVFLCVKVVREKRPFAYRILLAISLFSVSVFISILYFIDVLDFQPILIEGFFVMTVIFASLLAARFAQVHTDLENAHRELVIIDKMKDDFMATTSHELRTPLHGIKGISEAILDQAMGPVTDEQKKNLELISTSVNLLSDLVNQILDFSRVKARKVDLYLEKVSLKDVILSVVSLTKKLSEDENVNVYIDIDEMPHIIADKNKIQQVLINLIGNAIKYAPFGGADQGEITITARKRRNWISVSIMDNGIGIKNEEISKIWTPFVQLEESGLSNQSLGLGLAISKELIEMHGGRISLESEYGKGTICEFSLPIIPEVKGITKQYSETEHDQKYYSSFLHKPRDAENQDQGKKTNYEQGAKILVVDDDPINIQVIITACTATGFDIITAKTGTEALKLIKYEEPDLVLLDVMLPGISGFEVAEKIRERYKERFLPIIMLTALNGLSDILKGFRSGANDYLVKPFNRDELLARIENQLTIKNMHEKEKELNSELNIYKNIVSSSNDRMAFIDRKYSLLAINKSFLNMVKKNRMEVIHAHFDILFKETNINQAIKNHCDRCLNGEIVSFEKWIENRYNQERYMVFTFYPHYEEDSKDISGVVLNVRDLTDRVNIEKAMVNISENERQKIGMELHDGLSHHLLGIAIKARLFADTFMKDKHAERENIIEIETLVKDSIQKTREIARGLYPVNLSSGSLFELLDEIVNDLEKNHNIKTTVTIDSSIIITDKMVKTQLYYIIQEAVANIIKHAKASSVNIELNRNSDNYLELFIQDDGIGISDETRHRKGIGMEIMQARARMIGMSVEFHSTTEGGLKLAGKLLYKKNTHNRA